MSLAALSLDESMLSQIEWALDASQHEDGRTHDALSRLSRQVVGQAEPEGQR